jgi:small-conductance mechanosensitive channel
MVAPLVRARWLLVLVATLLALALPAGFAAGQDKEIPAASAIEGARLQLDQIKATLKRDNLNDDALADLRRRTDPLAAAMEEAIATLAPQLAAADARLAEIGAKPADGAPPESPEVTRERDVQTAARQKLDETIKRGRLVQVEGAQIQDEITQRRRALLADRLFQRGPSLLDPSLWRDLVNNAPRDLRSVRFLFSDWGAVIARNLSPQSLAAVGIAALIAFLLAMPGRRWVASFGERLVVQTPQSRLRRSATALLRVIATTLAPVLAMLALYVGLRTAGWIPERVDRLAVALVYAAGFIGFVQGMMRALFAPGRPSWRLTSLSDAAIAEIKNQPLWVALVFVLGRILDHFGATIVASLSASIVTNGVFALLNAGTFALALRGVRAAERVEAAADPDGDKRKVRPLLSLLRLAAWLAIGVVLLAVVSGYVTFGEFLANQVIWITAVLSLAYLLMIVVDDLFTSGLSSETRFGRLTSASISLRPESLDQIGVVLSGFLRVLLILVTALFVLAPWGLETTDVFGWLRLAVSGLEVGGIRISLSGVLGTILLVVIGFALTRAVQRWLDRDLLPKTRMDTGLKASINTGIGYLGGLVVIMMAATYLGFSLDRLAIVAGALSVGIGFGLQAIISNFVSGVILLAERPIKAGDWIVIGSDQGNVRRISVRSTEIELFDRSTLIVPNSDFITKSVKNVTHGNPAGRVQIELTVAADVSPETVRTIALETVKAHGAVLAFPEPQLFFNALGKAENSFALFCSVPSPRQAASVKSDLNFALVKAFKEHGVAIGGAAAPSMVDAVDRIGAVLGRIAPSLRLSEAGDAHDASAPPLVGTPPVDPHAGAATKA